MYTTLRKFTRVELEKIVDKELQEREHDYTVLANASRMHTKQVEQRFDAAREACTTQTVIEHEEEEDIDDLESTDIANRGHPFFFIFRALYDLVRKI
ncbi:hypothetical protein BGZ47_003254 [Haplosporangium gracile]|nr:hypothetical protein BGZ47_003254 [Haplosporangium gracile]